MPGKQATTVRKRDAAGGGMKDSPMADTGSMVVRQKDARRERSDQDRTKGI
jgi:hypothetical protein